MADPLRMYLVTRRGALPDLATGGELAGAAAVACVRAFADDPALRAWRERPGKVVLRARGAQWDAVLEEPHVLAGERDGAAVAALAPRRRSERGDVLERMQAMSSELAPPPAERAPDDDRAAMTYLLNPRAPMSSGKALAQIAHAAVMAADTGRHEEWVAAGCPGRVLAPEPEGFLRACLTPGLAAKVVDAGLTEVPPGTVTVLAVPPG